MAIDPADIQVGTARWTIPFGPTVDRLGPGLGSLARYARFLPATELNSSFYRHHRPSTYARWGASTPDSFRFSVKVPRAITHDARLALEPSLPVLDQLLGEVAHLAHKLGALLVQLPPSLQLDEAVAGAFFAALRARWPGAVACEPRHPSWLTPDGDALLVEHRVARVAADPAVVPDAAEHGGWPGLAYERLHGSPRIYHSRYDLAYVEHLAERLRAIAAGPAEQVWCIFDNTARGEGLANALELRALLTGGDAEAARRAGELAAQPAR